MTNEEFKKALSTLTAPFENPKWRVQLCYPKPTPTHCVVVPYVDARMVQDRFDKALGASNWANTYDPETGSSSISILIDGQWITKSDVGVESKVDKEKGKASDAFKRAAVMWGVGRDIYSLGEKSLEVTPNKVPLTNKGDKLYTPTALSNYMNKMSESEGLLYQLYNLNPTLHQDDEFMDCLKRMKEYVKK